MVAQRDRRQDHGKADSVRLSGMLEGEPMKKPETHKRTNGWTPERRSRQAEMIHRWQPWKHSTGAKTPEGKAKSSRNAFRFTIRKLRRFSDYLAMQRELFNKGLPCASIETINRVAEGVPIDLSQPLDDDL